MKVECLAPARLSNHSRATTIYRACERGLRAAGHEVRTVSAPSWESDWLIMWGLGHPDGQALIREGRGRGVRVLGWDLGYWLRDTHYRLSIDDEHPQGVVMAVDRLPTRWESFRVPLRECYRADGPIILIGIGRKSAETYGEQPGEWERRTIAAARAAWPGRELQFRPKAGLGNIISIDGLETRLGQIDDVLVGAALVVCRHSNVAVDAIVAGVPAIAEDGAASAVCCNAIQAGPLPERLDAGTRRRFLSNLSYFNWSCDEMGRAETWATISGIVALGNAMACSA